MIAAKKWSEDKIAGELGAVLLGRVVGRENAGEIIVLESVGMPAWDAASAAWAYRWALDHKAGTSFSLA